MLIVRSVWICFVSLLWECSIAYPDDSVNHAKSVAQDYMDNEEFALGDYLMVVDLNVTTSPESDLLFSSVGQMSLFCEGKDSLSFLSWRPTIADDARQGKNQTAARPFASYETVFEASIQGKKYLVVEGDQLVPLEEKNLAVPFHCVVRPYDWPLHTLESFSRIGSRDTRGLGKVCFGNKICFSATETNQMLESFWGVPTEASAYFRVRSKDDLIVRSELVLMEKKAKPESIDVRDKRHKVLNDIQTKWTKLGDADVPEEVNSWMLRESSTSSCLYQLQAKLKFFAENSPEYKSSVKKLALLRNAKVRDPDNPDVPR
jgi:hypothetical protein